MPDEVLDKIKYLCKNINTVEWSGMLFYTIEGSITKPLELKITLQDILPMDKGTAGATSYDIDERYMDYIMEDESRMNWLVGHVHSHHTMNVYFSHTDMSEINDNSESHNFYLSLIVNNYMEFVAKVAFRGKAETVTESIPYHALDENGEPYVISEATFNVSKEKMFTYDCEVISKSEGVIVESSFADKVKELMKPKTVTRTFPSHQKPQQQVKKYPTHTTTKRNANVIKNRKKPDNKAFQTFMSDFPNSNDIHPNLTEDHTDVEILGMSLLNYTEDLEEGDTFDSVFEFIDDMEISDIELSTIVLSALPTVFQKFYPEYDLEGVLFISIVEQLIEVYEQYAVTYPIINTTIEQMRAMLTKFEDYATGTI